MFAQQRMLALQLRTQCECAQGTRTKTTGGREHLLAGPDGRRARDREAIVLHLPGFARRLGMQRALRYLLLGGQAAPAEAAAILLRARLLPLGLGRCPVIHTLMKTGSCGLLVIKDGLHPAAHRGEPKVLQEQCHMTLIASEKEDALASVWLQWIPRQSLISPRIPTLVQENVLIWTFWTFWIAFSSQITVGRIQDLLAVPVLDLELTAIPCPSCSQNFLLHLEFSNLVGWRGLQSLTRLLLNHLACSHPCLECRHLVWYSCRRRGYQHGHHPKMRREKELE